jgi:Bacterial regulatory protein, Fis family
MTSQSLQSWITTHCKGNKSAACRALGITRPTLEVYLTGKKPVPKYIALACAAIENNLYSASQNPQKETDK